MPVFHGHADGEHHHIHPHIGLRKVKSILAIFIGFCLWQILRQFAPGLEVHPIFIYMYGMIEIRETSSKTEDYIKLRIKATFTALGIGLFAMLFTDWVKPKLAEPWAHIAVEITILLVGSLLVLCVAEWADCRVFCGLAAAIYMILMISHFESAQYLYSIMRAFQTLIGVAVAWFVNVVLLPYPPKPNTFSEKLMLWSAKMKSKKDSDDNK